MAKRTPKPANMGAPKRTISRGSAKPRTSLEGIKPLNRSLHAAKATNQGEFYTPLPDIAKLTEMPVRPSSKYWIGISRCVVEDDEREDAALSHAESVISKALLRSRVLHGKQWKKMTFMLNFFPKMIIPDRYKCFASKRHQMLHFTISLSNRLLKGLTVWEYSLDVARSFLLVINDALTRRGCDTDRLRDEIARLPRPKHPTAFVNLFGDVKKQIDKNDQLQGMEVVLLVPLNSRLPSSSEVTLLQKLERLIDREVRKANAGALDTREYGDGVAEFMSGCKKAAPVLNVLRDLHEAYLLPRDCRMIIRNLNTGTETAALF